MRRLVAWFDGKFAAEVTRNLVGEKHMKRLLGRGNPDAGALRTGYAAIKHHLEYVGWLSETRRWLAGADISLADFAAAAHFSTLDYIGDVDWTVAPAAKDWYARMKSRPASGACWATASPASPRRNTTPIWTSRFLRCVHKSCSQLRKMSTNAACAKGVVSPNAALAKATMYGNPGPAAPM